MCEHTSLFIDFVSMCVRACVCLFARACARACLCVYVRVSECVCVFCACVRVCVCVIVRLCVIGFIIMHGVMCYSLLHYCEVTTDRNVTFSVPRKADNCNRETRMLRYSTA